MRQSRRRVLAASAGTLATGLAGCLAGGENGDDETTAEPTDTDTDTDTATDTTTEADTTTAGDATVQVRSHPELGDVLVGPGGLTLYMFDNDAQGSASSACTDGCASAWPPLTVEAEPTAGGDVAASLSTFERADGSTQVAANGWPLYHYASDGEPGDASGQGVGDVWWVLRADGTPVRSSSTTTDGPGYGY